MSTGHASWIAHHVHHFVLTILVDPYHHESKHQVATTFMWRKPPRTSKPVQAPTISVSEASTLQLDTNVIPFLSPPLHLTNFPPLPHPADFGPQPSTMLNPSLPSRPNSSVWPAQLPLLVLPFLPFWFFRHQASAPVTPVPVPRQTTPQEVIVRRGAALAAERWNGGVGSGG